MTLQEEVQFVAASRRGEMYEVSAQLPAAANAANTIQASLIRDILLGLRDPAGIPRSVLLRGAAIEGVLDLRDCGGTGGVLLPPLILHRCLVLGDGTDGKAVIEARHVRLSRLSLSKCRIGRVDLTDATLGGDLDIEGIAPIDERRACQISARRCRIDGSVLASSARLRIPKGQRVPVHNFFDYALNLNSAQIAGSIVMQPAFVAEGGANVGAAHVRGDIWAEGSSFGANGDIAFRGQSLRCDGVVVLRAGTDPDGAMHACEARGTVDFSFATLGAIDFRGLRVDNVPARAPQNVEGGAPEPALPADLHLSLTRVRGAVFLGDLMQYGNPPTLLMQTRVGGTIFLRGAIIDGTLSLECHDSSTWSAPQIVANNVRVEGNLDLMGARGAIDIRLAYVGGALTVQARDLASLNARDAEVRGSVELGGRVKQWEKSDALCFDGGNYRGAFSIDELTFRQLGGKVDVSLSLDDARIERDLKVRGLKVEQLVPNQWAQQGPIAAKAVRPSFYTDWTLVEALCQLGDGEEGVVSFLLKDSGEKVLLKGDSTAIHTANARGALQLTDASVLDYLRFFCANVRGDEGAFLIVEKLETLDWGADHDPLMDKIRPATRQAEGDGWLCKATVYYGGYLFDSTFRVSRDGRIEMTEDSPLGEVKQTQGFRFAPAVRIVSKTARTSPFWLAWMLPTSESKEFSVGDRGRVWRELWEGAGEASVEPALTTVSLCGLKAAALNHDLRDETNSWGAGVLLKLEGFEYERVEHPEYPPMDFAKGTSWSEAARLLRRQTIDWAKSLAERYRARRASNRKRFAMWRQYLPARLAGQPHPPPRMRVSLSKESRPYVDWLARQYSDEAPKSVHEFQPQPYDQLARVLRNHGHSEVAKEITLVKLSFERRLVHRWWAQPFMWIMETFFSHGLFATRAVLTFLVLLLVGTMFFDFANYGRIGIPIGSKRDLWLRWPTWDTVNKPLLVVDSLAVSTVLPKVSQADDVSAGPTMRRPAAPDESAGEQRCGDQIEPVLYALDVLVPLLDLKQEEKCSMSSRDDAWLWRALKTAYAVLGAIVTSLLILTVSGVLRRHAEQ